MWRPIGRILLLLSAAGLIAACAAPAAPTAVPTKPAAAPPAATAAPSGTSAGPTASVANPTAAAAVTPAAKIKRGGSLSYAAPWTYPSLDPHLTSLGAQLPGYLLMFDSLLFYEMVQKDPVKWDYTPRLATSWEVTDPKTIIFKLRKGVKFQDGTSFDAKVAKWNLDRAMTHQKSYMKPSFESVDGVDVVDDSTIKMRLKSPSAGILSRLIWNPSAMVSPTAVEKMGDDEFGRRPVGSGPMMFSEWAKDDYLKMKKFDGYWDNGADGQPLPYVDEVVSLFRPDTTVMVLDLRAGRLDIAEYIEPKDVGSVQSDPNLRVETYQLAGRGMFVCGMNQQNGPLARNKKLRQAIQHGVDREAMAKAFGFGLAKAHYYPNMAEGLLGFSEDLPKYPYDPSKAKQLLSEAGYPNGMDLTLLVINRSAEMRISEMVKSMWDNIGIRTTLDTLERLAWIDKMKNMGFEVGFWGGGRPVDTAGLASNYGCGAPGNWDSYCNKAFDSCMDEGNATYDNAERDKIYRRCLTIVMEDAYRGNGYWLPYIWGLNKRVQDFGYQWQTADLRKTWLR